MPREKDDDRAAAQGARGFPVKDMWMEASEKTVPLKIQRPARGARSGEDPVRAAWVRSMAAKGQIDEAQAARLWDSDISLVPKEVFAAGFHSRDYEVERRELQTAALEDELRGEGKRMEALLVELEEKSERIHRLEGEGEKVRRLLKALAVLAAASAREEIASDPERMTQIAFSVLNDFSVAVAGDRESNYSSRPIAIGAAAAFRKLREEGNATELVSLYRELSALLRDLEPEFHSAEQKLGDREPSGDAAEAEGPVASPPPTRARE
jgi:hypothetical protein